MIICNTDSTMRGRSKFSTEATLKTERWEMFLNLERKRNECRYCRYWA